jgi:outer membrane protein OmpA-like peptidoglycan-associated protein
MNLPKSPFLPACALTLAFALVGCAGPGSYAVLLPSPDGSVGQISVQGPGGSQVLTQAMTGAGIYGGKPPFEVTQEQLARDFGPAMAARPTPAEQFMLYFDQGSQLTAESQALLQRVLERARARTSLDISVIGHTDTLGSAETNESLALERATTMAEQLKQLGLQDAVLTVESHGERNLLVKTPDDTTEPRNRRVEITLR